MNPTLILIVDDDLPLQQTTARVLDQAGYRTCAADDGQGALRVARTQRPDLILLDVVLPDISGLEVCKQIKADPDLTGCFVVLLSATRIDSASQIAGLESEADGYITRPLPNAELLARIRTFLRLKDTEDRLRASEERYRTLVEQASDGIFVADANGHYIDVNSAGCALLGYNRAEILQRSMKDLVSPDELSAKPLKMAELEAGQAVINERQLRHKDGSLVPVEISAKRLHDGRLQGIVRDITARKQVEDALRESEARFHSMFETHDAIMLLIEPETGQILEANQAAVKFYGYPKTTLCTLRIADINTLPPEQVAAERQRALHEERNYFVFPHRLAGGEERVVEVHSSPIAYHDKRVLFSIIHDITGRKRAEGALRESEERYRFIAENVGDVLWVMDAATQRFTYVSPSVMKLRGYTPEEVMAQPVSESLTPDSGQLIQELITKRLLKFKSDSQRPVFYMNEADQPCKDGSIVHTEVTITWSRSSEGQLQIVGVSRDITERKRAEDLLRLHSKVVENMTEGVVLVRAADAAIIYTNPQFEKMLGYAAGELIGQNITIVNAPTELSPEEIARDIQASLKKNGEWHGEVYNRKQDGQPFWCYAHVATFDHSDYGAVWVAVHQDITERKQADAALQEQERAKTELLKRLNDAQQMALVGSWEWDLRTQEVWWSEETYRIFDVTPQEFVPSFEANGRMIHPDDFARYGQAFEYALRTREPLDLPLRLVTNAGVLKHCHARGQVICDEAGQPLKFIGTIMDVSERRRAEEALMQASDQLALAQSAARAGMWGWDMLTGQLNWSSELYQLFGLDPDNTPATFDVWRSLIHPDDRQLAEDRINVAIRDHVPLSNDYRILLPSGEVRWITALGSTLYDEQGAAQSMSGICLDATERKQTEAQKEAALEALQASQALLGSVLNSSLAGIMVFRSCRTPQGLIEDFEWQLVNEAAERIVGLSQKDLLGRRLLDQMPGNKDEGLFDQYVKVVETGLPYDQEHFYAHEKVRAWFHTVAVRLGDGFVVTFSDIAERKQAEDALRESEERFRVMADLLPQIVFESDESGKLTYVNKQAYKILGYPEGTPVTGINTLDFYISEDRPRAVDNIKRRIMGQREGSNEYTMARPDGSRLNVLVYSNPIVNGGRMVGLRGIIVDITPLKQAEAEVRQLNAELEQRVQARTAQLEAANQELEAFSYSVSHDLRAPLRGIDGWSMALLEDNGEQLDAQGREYLDRVRREAQRMGQLIDDLLRLSRVARASLEPIAVDLSALTETITARLQAEQPERQFEFAIEPELVARGDARLLEVVLTNLLDNAVKFTRKQPVARIEFGRIEDFRFQISDFSAPLKSEMPETAGHAVSNQKSQIYYVRDNGVGFNPAFAQNLFGAFQRLHIQTEFPGTGVGLATVRRIIRRHGGEIWAEAAVDQGATFYFTLPPAPDLQGLPAPDL